MKRNVARMAVFALIGVVGVLAVAGGLLRKDRWKKVEEAMQKGLPESAIKHLDPIIEEALKEKAYPEAIKAVARKIVLEANIQGNKPEEKITRLEAAIARMPREMTPVLEAILADWYWHYFQQNNWRFLQRTATAEAPGKDFTTWDLPRLFAEIDKHFSKALAAEAELKAVPIAKYDALLEKGTMPDGYRPTLYDFVAHEALAFYAAGEQAGAKAEDAYELPASSPIFAPTEEFLAWKIETTDGESRTVRAIRLYQDLLKFHQNDKDRTAVLDVDLERLRFGHNTAFGEEKNARYKAALQRFSENNAKHELSAQAQFYEAGVLHQEGDFVAAHRLAEQGAKAFPESVGGKQCHNLARQIEAKSAQITTERVWNDPWPTIQVRYRNVTKVFFRAVRADWASRLNNARHRPEQLDEKDHKELLARKPDYSWSADLSATPDFKDRVEELAVPKDLKPGFYFLIASHEPTFGQNNNQVTIADCWVSKLALVMRTRWNEDRIEGFVLDALSGEPVADAKVQVWFRDQNNTHTVGPVVKSDQNGLFTTDGNRGQNGVMLLASYKDQQLAVGNDYHTSRGHSTYLPYQRTIFFTDRSLYRPGQTVQYKGISIGVDQDKDHYHVIGKRSLTVVFSDPNGKEIARQRHVTNDYGSFNGSFTAPRDRLMGQMTLAVEGERGSVTQVSVEEYKRPKFQVKLEAPKTAAKLNADVELQGKATAYTGAAVGGAKVRYRVTRQVQYPPWWQWFCWWRPVQSESQEIAHGNAVTTPDGTFPITFTARPDRSVGEKDEPTFRFTITADVTDTNGETRSADREIKVGYTALQATLTADDWQTDARAVAITIKTQTLDGEGQLAKGTLKVHRLKEPGKVHRANLDRGHFHGFPSGTGGDAKPPRADLSNPNSWELGEVVQDKEITTDKDGNAIASVELKAGLYRAVLETKDRFGKVVTARLPVQVLKPDDDKLALRVPNVVAAPKWTLEPGQEFLAVWGSGYDKARAFIEIEHRRKLVQSYWTDAGRTQVAVRQAVNEAMRGGFTLRVTMVRENRAYLTTQRVDVPWSNKNLTVKWEHFVSKLEPGKKETWTAVISGPNAKQAVAEMVAALYDQSLDAYLPHQWQTLSGIFRQDHNMVQSRFENDSNPFERLHGRWRDNLPPIEVTYRFFPEHITAKAPGFGFAGGPANLGFGGGFTGFGGGQLGFAGGAVGGAGEPGPGARLGGHGLARHMFGEFYLDGDPQFLAVPPAPRPNLGQVTARKNLNETAFFFPHLLASEDGKVKLEFTVPEALTQWRFLGFGHDRDLRSGYLEDKAVTTKDLMVEPNPPRFVREGDELEFTVKVSNQSDKTQAGTVRLTFADARTNQTMDSTLGNSSLDQPFDLPAKQSRSYSWKIHIADGIGPLAYKAVGSTDKLSDGEEGFLPVLSRRVLVTESLALPIRGPQTKTFDFAKLQQSGQSPTLKHQSLTIQMASQPAWYAIMALPYLMEYPYQCNEQVFNRLYANSLARHIAGSNPKIRRVFDQWKNTPALDSPLEKNQDLKAVMLEETPWLRQAQAESQARKNVGILFDDNRLNSEVASTFRKLAEQQLPDGAWPWFPGGPANDYITLYITTGFGRLRHLGVKLDTEPAVKSLARLDNWIQGKYQRHIKSPQRDRIPTDATIAMYLYGRSFFLQDKPLDGPTKAAVHYFLGQEHSDWLKLASRQSQAHLAIALHRFGDKNAAHGILRSIKERSVTSEEMGRFWRDTELSFFWFHAPIETQALMIEAFAEVMEDAATVEECKVWLLKQKQTQDWKTTKATADAIYGLLLRGEDLLASDALVEVKLGGTAIKPEKVEAGTGFYEQRFVRAEVKPEMGQVTLTKTDKGVAWGGLHWQYLEDVSKVTPHTGTPLTLNKSIFTRTLTKKGPVLEAVKGPLGVGDELVVRVVLRTDRDMEYVHLKDQRGSGTEPVNVLSRYRYQDGLGYYESTRDTASHFFIDYLPKGTYVFEYAVRVVHKGKYPTGLAEIQCMYAPEFNSHSESIPLEVK